LQNALLSYMDDVTLTHVEGRLWKSFKCFFTLTCWRETVKEFQMLLCSMTLITLPHSPLNVKIAHLS